MGFAPRLNKFFGWGSPGDAVSADERALLNSLVRHRFGISADPAPPASAGSVPLDAPRAQPPGPLADVITSDRPDRLAHAWGKSFPDLARAFGGRADHAPDLVAYPRDETDVVDILDWAAGAEVAVIPYGGGSSVVGGVTPDVGDAYSATVSLDLQRLDRVLEVDSVSMAARAQAGVLGPHLAEQLQPHGLALRHYPQSYRYSTLGGWIATRAGGHFATGPTHIDDFVESLRIVSPTGTWQTRRLPASGAGPDPNRLVLGSEGALGVITESWVRLQRRPRFRSGRTVRFDSLESAVAAVRAISQAELQPANLRLLDRVEAQNSLAGDGTHELLVVGFESADHDVEPLLLRAVECCRDHGGAVSPARGGDRPQAADTWRNAFMRMPYFRDVLVQYGVISETFETAVTWDRFTELHAGVTTAVAAALADEGLDPATVSCRFTHVYPDGVAPYFTVIAKGTPGCLDEQWWTVKRAASEAIEAAGGTITHHHSVGRDHMAWYQRERPSLFAAALTGARRELDPRGVMNPGVLIPAVGRST